MSLVALIRCDSYQYEKVYNSVQTGIDLLGGVKGFAQRNERILLKPNLLTGASPDKCITTHPNIFKAISELFISTGATISYGDGPGVLNPFTAARKSGIAQIAEELNISHSNFSTSRQVHFKNGKQNKQFEIVNAVFENDGIISLPKFKTHNLTRITGAVKNQFGCVPFLQKRILHARHSNVNEFSKMLLDLNQCINPRLYIMDSISAMEGPGPMSGYPKKLNVLGFSTDPIALDATMCRIIDLNPALVPTIIFGKQFGYGEFEENSIDIVGENIEQFICRHFKVNRKAVLQQMKKGFIGKTLNRFNRRPEILRFNCIRCGNCTLACPVKPKAIVIKNKYPVIDYDKCIRCFCCHENCNEYAIQIRTPFQSLLSLNR